MLQRVFQSLFVKATLWPQQTKESGLNTLEDKKYPVHTLSMS